MVDERRRKPHRHRHGDRAGLVGVALAALVLLAGCGATARPPLDVGDGSGGSGGGPGTLPGGGGSGGGGGGGGGSGNVDPALVGQWRVTFLVDLVGDLQTVTTTWTLGASGNCQRQVDTYSNLAGFTDTRIRACTFIMANFAIDVTFAGATGPVRYSYDFPGFSPTRLLLGGIEYQKL